MVFWFWRRFSLGRLVGVESLVYRFDDFGFLLSVLSSRACSVVVEFVFGDWWYVLFQLVARVL
jgi:hypothetical protein